MDVSASCQGHLELGTRGTPCGGQVSLCAKGDESSAERCEELLAGATRADEELLGGLSHILREPLNERPRSYWGDALIVQSDRGVTGGGGRFYRVDDTEELPGDAFMGAHVNILTGARVNIFGRVTSIYIYIYIWARHDIYIYIYIYIAILCVPC